MAWKGQRPHLPSAGQSRPYVPGTAPRVQQGGQGISAQWLSLPWMCTLPSPRRCILRYRLE
jgi:hypothetical protein